MFGSKCPIAQWCFYLGVSKKIGYPVPNPDLVGLGELGVGTGPVGIRSKSKFENPVASGFSFGL